MTKRPLAATKDIVVRHVDQEILLYNLGTDECFCLEGGAGTVWSLCDGTRTVEDLVAASGLSGPEGRDILLITLEQLRAKGLMEHSSLEGVGEEFRGMSRRAMIRKAAIAAAVPLVSAILAPTPAQAQSGCVGTNQPCTGSQSTQCCAGSTCLNTESGPTGFTCVGCVTEGNPCISGQTQCCSGLLCQPFDGVPLCLPISTPF